MYYIKFGTAAGHPHPVTVAASSIMASLRISCRVYFKRGVQTKCGVQ